MWVLCLSSPNSNSSSNMNQGFNFIGIILFRSSGPVAHAVRDDGRLSYAVALC
jgi:hypothetical protein